MLQKHYRNNHLEKKKCRNTGELPMFYAEGTHPAIIDADTFNAAQAVLEKLSEAASKTDRCHKKASSRVNFTARIAKIQTISAPRAAVQSVGTALHSYHKVKPTATGKRYRNCAPEVKSQYQYTSYLGYNPVALPSKSTASGAGS